MTTPQPTPLAHVLDQVTAADAALAEWHGKQTNIRAGRTYVAAGHRCVAAIDAALRALYAARAQLVGEMRQDADERAARVDLMLAEIRAEREARQAAGGDERLGPLVPPGQMPPRGTVQYGEYGGGDSEGGHP